MTEQEFMLTSILCCRRVDLYAEDRALTPDQQFQFGEMKRRRRQGEPLQYILGKCDFMGQPFAVDPRVLIPRPETELLVDYVIQKLRSQPSFQGNSSKVINILDLGTGSGNIAITLAKHISGAHVTAVDIDARALTVARQNAISAGVGDKIEFLCEDMRCYFQRAGESNRAYDVIISNPPYIPTNQLTDLPEDVRREPVLALNGGIDGLDFYRSIIHYSHQILSPEGFLCFEIGDGQRQGINLIFQEYTSYGVPEEHKDYVQTDRFIVVQRH